MPDTISLSFGRFHLALFALMFSIGLGFLMVFRLPVLDRYQFLEVSPIQKGTESSNLASGKSLSDFFPVDSAFLGFPRAWT